MRGSIQRTLFLWSVGLWWLAGAGVLSAQPVIQLASTEREPYIGPNLPQQGYVYEVVQEAFRRVGYQVEVIFHPWARAVADAKRGAVDGILPAYYNAVWEEQFAFSDPFPGDQVGLLKRKALEVRYEADPREFPQAAFRALKPYRFGMVRGFFTNSILDADDSFSKEFVTNNLQNFDKILHDRIDFIVIDKYTAANIMVNQRPHMIGELEFMEPPLAIKRFHLAFSKASKGHAQRLQDFNRGLQSVREDGTLKTILSKHGLYRDTQPHHQKTKLRIGTVSNPDMLIMQRLSEEFEKQHPHLELEWRILGENTLRQRLLGDLAISDGQFDIMTIMSYEVPIWAQRKWIAPLESIQKTLDVQDVVPSVRAITSYKDRLYAMPFYAESSMTYYRKDLFEKAGLVMPEQPTYDDIKRFAAAVHDPEHQTYGICLRGKAGWGENMAFLSTMVNTFGGRWFDENWHPVLQSLQWKTVLGLYQELLTQYGPPQPHLKGFTENLELFSQGHCGVWIDATVAAGLLFNPEQSQVHDKVGFVRAPIAVTPKGSHWLTTWAFAVPTFSKRYSEALEFITWATSKEYIQLVAQTEGWVAVPPGTRLSTYLDPHYQKAAPFANFVLDLIRTANPQDATLRPVPYTGIQFVGIPEFPAIGTQVGQEIARILTGTSSVTHALQTSQRLVTRQMQSSGYIK